MGSRNYCITSYKNINDLNTSHENIKYLILGQETCPTTGRNHLQGYIELNIVCRIKKLKEILNDTSLHCEKRQGTREQARTYCMKENNFVEFGDFNKSQGTRTDLKAVAKAVAEGESVNELALEAPEVFVKNFNGLRKLENIVTENKRKEEMKAIMPQMLPHQQELHDMILTFKDKRKIYWFTDLKGGYGKSLVGDWLSINHSVLKIGPMSIKDAAYMYGDQEYVIIDIPRRGFAPYEVMEMFTNYSIYSTKYEPVTKLCRAKVIVFANWEPDYTAMSQDRWHHVTLCNA